MYLPCSLHRWFGVLLALCVGLLATFTDARAQDQPYTIQGTVVDAGSQEPLSGVAVALQGTSLGTLSDAGGRFTLIAPVEPGTYTVRFTLIGRDVVTEQVELADQQTVQLDAVAMTASAVELEEIVVTGTGVSAQRRAVPNTVATVEGEEIAEAPGASTVDQALQGKVTGAIISETSGQPGGGMSIRLRGTSSILGGADPLIVVDGVILDNSDAALVSLGANAGRGSAALSNRLADIAPGDIARIEVLKGAAAAGLYGSRANNGVIQIFTKSGQQGEPRITFRTEASISQTPDQYDLLLDYPYAGFADVLFAGADSIGAEVERFDIQDEIFRTAGGMTNYLSIAGGNPETTYFVSGVYNREDGIIRSTDYEKMSGRAKLTQRLSDELQVTANANFLKTETNFQLEGEQTTGTLTGAIFQPTAFDFHFDPELGRYPYLPVLGANPLDVIENWAFPENVTRFIGNVETVWTPVENLSLRYLFAIDDYRQENKYFQPPRSVNAGDPGTISNPVRLSRQLNSDLVLTHDATLGESAGLTTTAGFRYTSDRGEVITAAASDLPPGQTTVGGAVLVAGQSITEIRTVGGFLQERLSLGDRLYLTGGVNVEGSSTFGEDQRYQFFPSLGASWVVDEEPFFQGSGISEVFSTLRLRAAYGQTGAQPPGAYIRFNNYGNVAYGGLPGLVPSSLAGNPDLKPERQREYEAGFEAGFFDNRARLDFTYYDQLTTDLVLPVPLPLSSGYSTQYQNIGEISNTGIEIALNTINVQRPGFSWTTRIQYFTNENRVEQLVTASDTTVSGYLNAVIEGEPIGVFYGAYYERGPDGEIVIDPATGLGRRARDTTVVNGDTTITVLRKVIGNPHPDFTASLSNTLEFNENLQLSFLLDGRFGNDVANFTRRITEFFGSDAIVREEIERARERKTNPDLQPIQYALNGDRIGNYEEYVEDGSFVKLREIALSYTFDQPWVQQLGAESMSLRVAGRNLYTWTEYSGLDPEINLFAGNTVARGVDFAVTPVPRQFIVGATFTF